MLSEAEINKKIKQYRVEKGITLQRLAEMTHLTKGYLSRIENSLKAPPISTLVTISKALNIRISEVLGEMEENIPITVSKGSDRQTVSKHESYAYEALAHAFPNKHMEPWILTTTTKVGERRIFEHQGEEIVYVLEGRIKFFHGDQEFILEQGDCIYFDSGKPHGSTCLGNKDARMLVVIYSPDPLEWRGPMNQQEPYLTREKKGGRDGNKS
jgi:transcriptional regulator with XRE-family HTH domain